MTRFGSKSSQAPVHERLDASFASLDQGLTDCAFLIRNQGSRCVKNSFSRQVKARNKQEYAGLRKASRFRQGIPNDGIRPDGLGRQSASSLCILDCTDARVSKGFGNIQRFLNCADFKKSRGNFTRERLIRDERSAASPKASSSRRREAAMLSRLPE